MRSTPQNPKIGTNLHIHPVNSVAGHFKEEIRPWEGKTSLTHPPSSSPNRSLMDRKAYTQSTIGGIITAYISEFENLDNKGHGVKIETTCMVVSPPANSQGSVRPYPLLPCQPKLTSSACCASPTL